MLKIVFSQILKKKINSFSPLQMGANLICKISCYFIRKDNWRTHLRLNDFRFCRKMIIFPFNVTNNRHCAENDILYGSNSQSFVNHHRNANKISDNPKNPVFDASFRHEPHSD